MNVYATKNEEKKRFLTSYQACVRREKRILKEIKRLEYDKYSTGAISDGMPRGSSKRDFTDVIILIDTQIEKLHKERLRKIKTYTKVADQIAKLEDDKEREVLELRYIQNMKWEKIAVYMDYTERQMHRIHSNALEHLRIN